MVRIAASVVRLNSSCKQREQADRRDDVVKRRHHRAEAELPLEAEPDINHDRAEGEHGREHAGADQLAADGRPDHLDAAVFDIRSERLLRLF